MWLVVEGMNGDEQGELWQKDLFTELREGPGRSRSWWKELAPRLGDASVLAWVLVSPEMALLLLPRFNVGGKVTVKKEISIHLLKRQGWCQSNPLKRP